MAASAEMPYFIKPSVLLNAEEKRVAYRLATDAILATLGDEKDSLVKMVTVNSLLKTYLPYFYWVGFYLVRSERELVIGPYQGTLGCLTIAFGRGVCGKAAATGEIQIVPNTHALAPGRDHIACDPNSASEIVLPVFKQDGNLMGVFDVDATKKDAFDEIDAAALEALLRKLFSNP